MRPDRRSVPAGGAAAGPTRTSSRDRRAAPPPVGRWPQNLERRQRPTPGRIQVARPSALITRQGQQGDRFQGRPERSYLALLRYLYIEVRAMSGVWRRRSGAWRTVVRLGVTDGASVGKELLETIELEARGADSGILW